MGSKGKHGAYYYYVYDVKTNELLAEGIAKRVAEKMNWDVTYPNSLAQLDKIQPNRKRRYERIERKWVDTIWQITDRHTKQSFSGTYEECGEKINQWLGKTLKPSSLKNYIYRDSGRFDVRRLNNV